MGRVFGRWAIRAHGDTLFALANRVQSGIVVKRGSGPIRDTTALLFSTRDGTNWRSQPAIIHYDMQLAIA